MKKFILISCFGIIGCSSPTNNHLYKDTFCGLDSIIEHNDATNQALDSMVSVIDSTISTNVKKTNTKLSKVSKENKRLKEHVDSLSGIIDNVVSKDSVE